MLQSCMLHLLDLHVCGFQLRENIKQQEMDRTVVGLCTHCRKKSCVLRCDWSHLATARIYCIRHISIEKKVVVMLKSIVFFCWGVFNSSFHKQLSIHQKKHLAKQFAGTALALWADLRGEGPPEMHLMEREWLSFHTSPAQQHTKGTDLLDLWPHRDLLTLTSSKGFLLCTNRQQHQNTVCAFCLAGRRNKSTQISLKKKNPQQQTKLKTETI